VNTQHQVAVNPLAWMFSADGQYDPSSAPPLSEIYSQVRDAGFDAVHIEPPQGMPLSDYRLLLADAGLAPAPGYFEGSFEEAEALGALTERARLVAAQHAALGLDRIFIAQLFGTAPERMATPAVGAAPDRDRTARIAEGIGFVCEAMVAEGVVPCLHQHVGTWIETIEELDLVMASVDPKHLLLGPDTGHLAWAGADPAAVIERYLDRLGAVHLKDVRASLVSESRAGGPDYLTSATKRHLWTEPGRGDVDFPAVLAVLAGYDGWYVIEVDVADQPTPAESARVSAEWVKANLSSP
jgi:inosose dehydratase